MAVLCLVAYAFGWAIRFNIAWLENAPDETRLAVLGERLASWVLALAYFISVAYYLNLFGAFSARLFGPADGELKKIVTTAIYLIILLAGLTRGFDLLERPEQVSVSLKLAIIAALVAGLVVYTGQKAELPVSFASAPTINGIAALQMMFGLIVTVQGFETSRYLGAHYSASERICSMKLAQSLSALIYITYVALLSMSFSAGSFVLTETAIIDLMAKLAAILAPLLIIAALTAQFSAAIADTAGSGGLVSELTGGRFGDRKTYIGVAVVGIVLTWAADIFSIISLASRAFALYYAIQAALACARVITASKEEVGDRKLFRFAGFVSLAALGLAAFVFGIPVEAG